MNRSTLVRLADALEDLMTETGRGETADDREVWWTCRPLWVLVQRLLRRNKEGKDDGTQD